MADEFNDRPGRFKAAELVFNDFRRREQFTAEIAAAYGRWLVASMLLAHGAGLIGFLSFLGSSKSNSIGQSSVAITVACLTAGLVFAFICGFCAWVNWSAHSADYMESAPLNMLYDQDAWVETPKKRGWIEDWTNWGAVASGIVSVALIPIAVMFVIKGYHPGTETVPFVLL